MDFHAAGGRNRSDIGEEVEAMRRGTMTALATGVAAVAFALPAAGAGGDGLPVGNLDTSRIGIGDPVDGARYFALPRGRRTEVLRIAAPDSPGLQALKSRSLGGTLAVPGVALDGTTAGITSGGSLLALIEPRESFPRRSTRIVLLDVPSLRTAEEIELDGDFSFDAIAPDGSTIYLIHYLDARDPSKYEVRAWDVDAGRLLREPIIDRRTAPEVMRGYPMTRATSPDGDWAYTLYDGGGQAPFVHALNTADATALCIDLVMLDGVELQGFGLVPSSDGGLIDVTDPQNRTVATISTADWQASEPAPATPPAEDGGGIPSGLIGGLLVLAGVGLLGMGWRRRRRRRGADGGPGPLPPDPLGELQEEDRPAAVAAPDSRNP
jgi:hypothetical protein